LNFLSLAAPVGIDQPKQFYCRFRGGHVRTFPMKIFSPILLACVLAIPSFAQDAKTNAMPDQTSATNKMGPPAAAFPASAGVITAPFVLTNGILSQPEQTDVAEGGKAIYNFTITNAGNYLILGMVNAEEESMNSFFVNVDTQPDDLMIWDIDLTKGFEERTVNWRGNGAADSGEFVPKRFKLSAGAHKLIIVGREPAQLKSISIRPTAE
jgi:hypothetical protein